MRSHVRIHFGLQALFDGGRAATTERLMSEKFKTGRKTCDIDEKGPNRCIDTSLNASQGIDQKFTACGTAAVHTGTLQEKDTIYVYMLDRVEAFDLLDLCDLTNISRHSDTSHTRKLLLA